MKRRLFTLIAVLLATIGTAVVVAPPASAVTYVGKVCFFTEQNLTGNWVCMSYSAQDLADQIWVGIDDFGDIYGYDFDNLSSSLSIGSFRADLKCEAIVSKDVNFYGPARLINPGNDHVQGWWYENDIWKLGNYYYTNTTTNLGNNISSMRFHCWSIL